MFKSAFHWLQTAGPSKVIHFAGYMRKTGLFGSVCQCGNFEISHSRLWPGLACAEWVCKIHDKICYLYVGKNVINGFPKQKSCLIVWKKDDAYEFAECAVSLFCPLLRYWLDWFQKNTFSDKRLVEIPFRYCKKTFCPTEDLSIFPFLVPGLICTFLFWTILNLWCWF